LCDNNVQKIIDTFNMLSPENQNVLLKCARNILKDQNSVKKSADRSLEHEEKIF
jgi:hypothetical protein